MRRERTVSFLDQRVFAKTKEEEKVAAENS